MDEESKLPKQSSEHFTTEVHKRWQGHFRLALARASRLKAHREIRDDEGFMVRHFAGAVCYQTVSIYMLINIYKKHNSFSVFDHVINDEHYKFKKSISKYLS